jgi:hypothetical protein
MIPRLDVTRIERQRLLVPLDGADVLDAAWWWLFLRVWFERRMYLRGHREVVMAKAFNVSSSRSQK